MILSNGMAVPAQLDTIADRTPIFADASYYPAGSALPMLGMWQAYGAIYKYQLWVNTIVRKLAFATARLPFDVKVQGDNNDQTPEDGPLTDLMDRPNPRLDPFRLWLWTSATYDVYGEAFWLKLRDQTGRVRELHPMHPTNVIVRRLPTGGIEYIYSAGVRNVSLLPPIPEADVVPFLAYNPDNMSRGLSTLEPLRQTLLDEDAARRATASWWARGARPSLMISAPQPLSDRAYDRLQSKVGRVHGGADQMGGTLVLEEGAKPIPVQLSSEEMQYIETRKLNREEVCAAYDVPPPVIHILDNATFSNITEQMRSMYRDTMAPRLGLFESVVAHHLVPDFDQTGDVFVRFNMDEVMRGDFETRAKAAAQMVQTAILKPSEARPMFGLPPAGPEADELYANSSIQRLGKPAEQIRITAMPTASPAEDQELDSAEEDAGIDPATNNPPAPAAKPTQTTRTVNRSQRRAAERRGRLRSEEQE